MGYSPKHALRKAKEQVVRLSWRQRSVIGTAAALASIGGFILTGAGANASIFNNQIETSNGESGWETWSFAPFDEVHADVSTDLAAEQVSPPTGQTLGNGVALCKNLGADGQAVQLGQVWNAKTNRFDVAWAEGTVTATTPNTNGSPCTTGGALPVTLGINGSGGSTISCTPPETCGLLDGVGTGLDSAGVPLGNDVYLAIHWWHQHSHLQVIAEDLTNGGANLASENISAPSGSPNGFFAQAGTTADTTGRSAPASIPESSFCWVRASLTNSGDGNTAGQYFSNVGIAGSVDSSPSGTSGDPALVHSTPINPHVPGGLGCFNVTVGSPVS